jgi:Icc-related predicted phosphoesterase
MAEGPSEVMIYKIGNKNKGVILPTCFFATDLHGRRDRYDKLVVSIIKGRPVAVFLGGDLLPRTTFSAIQSGEADFVQDYLLPAFARIRNVLGTDYPDIFLILGNDDPRREEEAFVDAADDGLWHYIHGRKAFWKDFPIYGLAYVPPTPFMLKDWERYDVSRYVPPGCLSPEEGHRSVPAEESEIKWATIHKDLASLVGKDPLDRAVFLFHTPPCDTSLDRAELDGKTHEHVALDPHVGSIAVKRFIEERQPLLTLHGHIHESARLTGEWKIRIGRTVCINGAHDGPELSLVRFDLESPDAATRELL